MNKSLTPGLDAIKKLITAVGERDLAGILNSYEKSDELYVFLEGPRWSSRTYDSVSTGWTSWINANIHITKHEWIEGPVEVTGGGLASVQGMMNLHTVSPAQTKIIKARGTWVLREGADGEWRIVHEHVSAPMEDPYGTGDWKQ